MTSKILCVEDDSLMQVLIKGTLQNYQVTLAASLQEAEKFLRSENFDALILDILLPDGDGLKFWSRLSQEEIFAEIPAIFLTGQGEISNKLLAFSVGAEDFITKPFDPLELQARLARRLKTRARPEKEQVVRRIGDLEIDLDRQKVVWTTTHSSLDLSLTAIELKILAMFSKRLDQVFGRQEILILVWGESFVSDRTVDSHIAHLRSKISETQLEIQTVKKLGYRLSLKK